MKSFIKDQLLQLTKLRLEIVNKAEKSSSILKRVDIKTGTFIERKTFALQDLAWVG